MTTMSLILLFYVLLSGGGPQSQPAPMPNTSQSTRPDDSKSRKPTLDVDERVLHCAEPVYDFGEVWSSTIVEHDFMVTNRSPHTVWVDVVPSCVCLNNDPLTVIGPHETAPVHVRLYTRGMQGMVTKSVRLKIVRTAATRPIG